MPINSITISLHMRKMNKPLPQSLRVCSCSVNSPAMNTCMLDVHLHDTCTHINSTMHYAQLIYMNSYTIWSYKVTSKIFPSVLEHIKNIETWTNADKCSINGEKQASSLSFLLADETSRASAEGITRTFNSRSLGTWDSEGLTCSVHIASKRPLNVIFYKSSDFQ